MPVTVTVKRLCFPVLGTIVLLGAALKLHRFWQDRFEFDDAYMYSRYAYNFRHGWGISWNPGGTHTFGLTSLPWFFTILCGSHFVKDDATLLTAASCITGLVSIAAICLLIRQITKSSFLRRPLSLFPVVGSLLLLNSSFDQNWCNGMETMLALLSTSLFLLAYARFDERRNLTSLFGLWMAATLSFLVRPELLLVVTSLPLVAAFFRPEAKNVRLLSGYFALLGFGLLGIYEGNKLYFGTPVPLAFYLKALHGYEGFRLFINPWASMAIFLSIALPFLLFLAGLTTRKHRSILVVYGTPLALTMLYLMTVVQIMGGQARYYVPLLPLLIAPAALVLDEALLRKSMPAFTGRRAAALLLVLLFSRQYTQQVTWSIALAIVKTHTYYTPPVFLPRHTPSLPPVQYWKKSAEFARLLPAGTVMASSEVGILGASAPQITILDLAGLNDLHLALHPADCEYVFAQKPDVLWLPHPDYARFYGSLAADPRLLRDYNLYAGGLNFGLAIRKSSESHPAFALAVDQGWNMLYPGYRRQDYLVHEVQWDRDRRVRGTAANILD